MTEFTDAEKDTIRGGVMGAVALVSQADPGFFDVFKESKAAAGALKDSPAEIRELVAGGLQMPPSASSKEELKAKMLSGLSEAMTVASKDAATAASLKQFVQAACQQVAEASKGVSAEETAVIAEINQALEQTATATPAAPAAPVEAPVVEAPAATPTTPGEPPLRAI